MIEWFARVVDRSETRRDTREMHSLSARDRPFESFRHALGRAFDPDSSIHETLQTHDVPALRNAWREYGDLLMQRSATVRSPMLWSKDHVEHGLEQIKWNALYRNSLYRSLMRSRFVFFPLLEHRPRCELLPKCVAHLERHQVEAQKRARLRKKQKRRQGALRRHLLRQAPVVLREVSEATHRASQALEAASLWQRWSCVNMTVMPRASAPWPDADAATTLSMVHRSARLAKQVLENASTAQEAAATMARSAKKTRAQLKEADQGTEEDQRRVVRWVAARLQLQALIWGQAQAKDTAPWPGREEARRLRWLDTLIAREGSIDATLADLRPTVTTYRRRRLRSARQTDALEAFAHHWRTHVLPILRDAGDEWRARAVDAMTLLERSTQISTDALAIGKHNATDDVMLQTATGQAEAMRSAVMTEWRRHMTHIQSRARARCRALQDSARTALDQVARNKLTWLHRIDVPNGILTRTRHEKLRQLVAPVRRRHLDRRELYGPENSAWQPCVDAAAAWCGYAPRTWKQYVDEWPLVWMFIRWIQCEESEGLAAASMDNHVRSMCE